MLKFHFPEGATPLSDCSGLIPSWVHTMGDLNRVEAENILKAQRKYLKTPVSSPGKWFHIGELKKIHIAMYGDVWSWAGKYRKSVTSIGIKPALILSQLAELCRDVTSWIPHPVELTFVEMAARIHHRLVYIHPFENGNGRFSRLIADRFLMAWRCPHPKWPDSLNHEGIVRKDYIETLKRADKGDYAPLVDLMKKLGAKDPTLSMLLKEKHFKEIVSPEITKALIREGASPAESTNGQTPLHLAAREGLYKVAEALIEAGATLDSLDKNGRTPLETALEHNHHLFLAHLSRNRVKSWDFEKEAP